MPMATATPFALHRLRLPRIFDKLPGVVFVVKNNQSFHGGERSTPYAAESRLRSEAFQVMALRNGNPSGDPSTAPRCGARTRRADGRPCQAPAVRGKRRCRMHGGLSTGPRTPEGLERSQRARLKHGHRARLFRVQRVLSREEALDLFWREEARQPRIANRWSAAMSSCPW